MLFHVGSFGFAGGRSARSPVWHTAHVVPTRIGGEVGSAGLNAGVGYLRRPMMPVALGSLHRSMNPVDASPAVQSGSLITPNVSKRVARGATRTASTPSRRLNGGFGIISVKNFSLPYDRLNQTSRPFM